MEQRLGKKIKAICENPEIGEPKSHNLKGLRGEHVDHHDKAYASAYEIAKALINDEGLLTTLAKVGITPEELAAFIESIGQ